MRPFGSSVYLGGKKVGTVMAYAPPSLDELAYGQVRRWDARIPAASYAASAYMIVLGFAPGTRLWRVMQLDGDHSGAIIALPAETVAAWPLVAEP